MSLSCASAKWIILVLGIINTSRIWMARMPALQGFNVRQACLWCQFQTLLSSFWPVQLTSPTVTIQLSIIEMILTSFSILSLRNCAKKRNVNTHELHPYHFAKLETRKLPNYVWNKWWFLFNPLTPLKECKFSEGLRSLFFFAIFFFAAGASSL